MEQWEISHEPEANHLASEQRGEEYIFQKGKKAQGAGAEVPLSKNKSQRINRQFTGT